MPLYEIISLIGFILGTTLHIVLSILIVQRKHKTRSELVFLFLVISVAMWHFRTPCLLSVLYCLVKVFHPSTMLLTLISYAGIGFMPSLLLHTAVLFLFESRPQIKNLQRLIIIAFYLLVIPFSVVIKKFILSEDTYLMVTASHYVKPFVVWLIVALFIAASISKRLSKMVEEKEVQKFHLAIFWSVIAITILIGLHSFWKVIGFLYRKLSCSNLHAIVNLPKYYLLLLCLSV